MSDPRDAKSEPFFIVSATRFDGGTQSTTLLGYAAEGLALQYARELEQSKYTSYVQVIQRWVSSAAGRADIVTWDVVRHHVKDKAENPHT